MKQWNKIITGLTAYTMLLTGGMTFMPESAVDFEIRVSAYEEYEEYTEGTYESLTYANYGDHIKIIECDTSLTTVEVPAEIDGVEVTVIGDFAFADCFDLTSITLPETIISIESCAFEECNSLTTIQIPAKTSSIGLHVFSACYALESITVADGSTAFKSMDGILMSYDGTTIIRYPDAKEGTIYSVPDGVVKFAPSAFNECNNLKEIILPASFSVYHKDFSFWDSLQSITVAEDNQSFKSVDGILMSYDGTTLVRYPCAKEDTIYSVPDGVVEFASGAFDDCNNLKEIILPASFNVFDSDFYFCDSLQSITVAEDNQSFKSVDGILYSKDSSTLFYYPSNKAGDSFAIPAGTTTLYSKAFAVNANLLSVTAPDTLREIGHAALSRCMNLQSVTLPDSMDFIDSNAFAACPALTDIKLPSDVERIDPGALFISCPSLTTIKLPENITVIGSNMFNGCSELTSISIPATVTEIKAWAFDECTSLTDVYFAGTEAEWNAIEIAKTNTALLNATIHFNASGIPDTPVSATFGDVDCDGKVDILDIIVLNRNLLGSGELTAQGRVNADVNRNNKPDADDSLNILKFLVKLTDKLPAA